MKREDLAQLSGLGPCVDGLSWALTQPSLAQAWRRCKQGEWMLWYALRSAGGASPKMCAVLADCARLALPHVPEDEPYALAAIEALEALASGKKGSRRKLEVALDNLIDTEHWNNDAVIAVTDAVEASGVGGWVATGAGEADDMVYQLGKVLGRPRASEACATIVRRHFPTLASLGA